MILWMKKVPNTSRAFVGGDEAVAVGSNYSKHIKS